MRKFIPAWLGRILRRIRIWHERVTFRVRQVRHTYGGEPLIVELRDPGSAGWYDHDWDPLPELEFLREQGMGAGKRIFDIGAHQGVVAMMISRMVAPGEVVAVEANLFNADAAKRNAELNRMENLRVVHGAISSTSGELLISADFNAHVSKHRATSSRVRAYTIDELAGIHGEPDVLFIDVEGFEIEALKGAQETMRNGKNCFVEVHVGCGLENFGGSATEVLHYFPEGRYELFYKYEEDMEFKPLTDRNQLPGRRFFLIACVAQR